MTVEDTWLLTSCKTIFRILKKRSSEFTLSPFFIDFLLNPHKCRKVPEGRNGCWLTENLRTIFFCTVQSLKIQPVLFQGTFLLTFTQSCFSVLLLYDLKYISGLLGHVVSTGTEDNYWDTVIRRDPVQRQVGESVLNQNRFTSGSLSRNLTYKEKHS